MFLRRRLPRSAAPLLSGVLIGLVAAGVVVAVRPAGVAPAAPGATAAASAGTSAAQPSATAAPDPLAACAPAVAALDPRERLAQRLVVGVDGADPDAVVDTVRATQVGGIFIGGNATALLRNQALRPGAGRLADPARGVGRRRGRPGAADRRPRRAAAQRPPDGGAEHPGARSDELARTRGKALAARGVTVDFAPVVDVGGQPANSVIGDRAFSDDPAVVARYAGAFADGLRAAGVLPVLKHFPGHGHASGDSHKGRVTTPPLADLRATDLRPYTELLDTGTRSRSWSGISTSPDSPTACRPRSPRRRTGCCATTTGSTASSSPTTWAR